jgi:hypothetical protein
MLTKLGWLKNNFKKICFFGLVPIVLILLALCLPVLYEKDSLNFETYDYVSLRIKEAFQIQVQESVFEQVQNSPENFFYHPKTFLEKLQEELQSKPFMLILVFMYLGIIFWYLFRHKYQDYKKCTKLKTDLEDFKNLLEANNKNIELKSIVDNFCKQEAERNPDYSLGKVWIEFTEGLVEINGKHRNTFQSEDFFTEKDIIKPKLDLLDHIPSVCSALGLLFTFIALGEGLGHLNMKPDNTLEGIDQFINALSSKFVTSIIGLYLAIVIDGIVVRDFSKSYKNTLFEINTLLNSNFNRITVQELIKDLNKTVVEELPGKIQDLFRANSNSHNILSDLKQVIGETVNSAVSGINQKIESISNAMENFSSAGIDGMATQLATIGEELRNGLTQGLNKDLEGLKNIFESLPNLISESMREMSDSTKQIKTSLEESQQEMSRLIQQVFQEVNSKQGDNLNAMLENIVTKNSEIMDKISVHQETMQATQEEAFRNLTAKLVDNNQNIANQMQEVVKTIIDNLSQQTNNMTNSLGESTKNLMNDYADFAGRSKASLEDGYKQIVDNQESFKQSIVEILAKFDDSFNPLLVELKTSVGELSRQTLRLPEELNKSTDSLQVSMQALKRILETDLAEYLKTQSRITQDQAQTLTDLGSYLTTVFELQKENKNIQELMAKLVDYQNNFEQNMKTRDRDIKTHLEDITAGMSRQKDIISDFNKSFNDLYSLTSNLGNNFGNLGDTLADAILKLKESSNDYHSNLSEYSVKALQALTGYAEELSADLSGKIEGLKR